jgi:urease accessory protein
MTVADPPTADRSPDPDPGAAWPTRLRLQLARVDHRTEVVELAQRGRLSLEPTPTALPGQPQELRIAYPPSGVASGERSRLKVDLTDAGHARLTTSGPVRLRRSAGPTAVIERQLTVSTSSMLEWLPRETVVLDGADATLDTRVILEEQARFLGWEIVELGESRPGAPSMRGRLRQRLEVRRAGEPLLDEVVVVDVGAIRTSTGASPGRSFGTLVAVDPLGIDEGLADEVLRSLTQARWPGSVWQGPGSLVARIAATTAEAAAAALGQARRQLLDGPLDTAATDASGASA